VQPFFASEVFVPRLEEFSARYPEIELFVDTSDETAEKHPVSVDASIRLFRRAPANLDADMLFPLRLLPACSPDFRARYQSDDGTMTTSFPMLVHTSRPEAWSTWSKASGVELPDASRIVRLDSMIAVARAAERGVGAALVPVPLSDNWFKYGALVPLFDDVVTMPEAFYLVYPASSARSAEVQALRQWVLDTFQEDAG
jgi:LysR family glycine cleavage system transcriptional activator